MAIEVFNRYEHKYILNQKQFDEMIKVMNEYMNPDPYNKDGKPYTITNIYYDTQDDHLIRASLSKPIYKEKLRLRAYGVPKDGQKVFLEIKKKYNGIVNKRRTTLKLDEAYKFVNSGEKPEIESYMNKQVINEISYFLKVYDLKPKLYLAYDRIAYFEKGNDDLRISFDQNIRSRREDVQLEIGDHGNLLLEEGQYLMEIKTSLAMPLWLTHTLARLDLKRQSFSKYGAEFKNTVNQGA
ncbi:MAG: polyphosphate polymerase domain-containing protein [Firmicutes bacterium]|nr:polyphosphate polymerase domain-containing protein [Bacillota bacterium]